MKSGKKIEFAPYCYLVPSMLIFAVFLFYPFFKTIYLSLFMTNKMGQAKLFVGLQNYIDLLNSKSFQNSLKVTVVFVLIVVVGGMLLGLVAAVLCNKAFPGIRVFTIDDKLYSMPFNSSTPIMYYNKDMFAQAGITEVPDSLEGISKIGDQLMNQGGASEVMSLGIYGWFFEQFVGKQGLDYANNGNGRDDVATAVDFDKNEAAKNILTEWQTLNQEGYAPIVGKGGDAGLADFSAGKSAITLGSTASLKQILQDVNGKFEVGTAYFPKIKESDEGGVSIGGASLWALNNQDPKKLRATWEFVKFLISPESQAYWNAQTGYFPVTTAAHEEQTFKDNIAQYPQFQTAIDQLHDSSPEYCGALLSVFPEARATVESEIESMLNGKESVDEAVTNMADTINKSIDDYNTVNN